ncbi:hypothetical protein G6F63_013739 [Rhizopus arrhizus]|nr:hypothetical protein G6F63_013739 [Rhizopus arrhizus]
MASSTTRPMASTIASKRHGDGDDGDDAGAQVAQEEEDHQHHQDDGFADGVEDGIDGAFDEHRRVVRDVQLHACGQGLVQALDFQARGLGQLQRVGGGLPRHTDVDRRLAVKARQHAVAGGRDLDLGHVAQADRIALHVGHDHVFELGRRLQVGGRHHRELAGARLDTAGRDLDVLAAQRGLDVLHGQAVGGQLVAIDVDAHGRQAFAEDADFGRPREH